MSETTTDDQNYEQDMLQQLIDRLSVVYDAGRYKDAIPAAYEVLRYDSTNRYALNSLGYSLICEEKYEEAEEIVRQCLSHYPEESSSYELLGILHGHQGQHDVAAEYFQKCIAIQPEHEGYRLNYAQSLYNGIDWKNISFRYRFSPRHLERVHKAIDHLHEANRLNPNEKHMILLAKLCDSIYQLDEAFEYLKEGLLLSPMNDEIHALLARYYLIQGDLRFAEPHCIQALEMNPESTIGLEVHKSIEKYTNDREGLYSYSKSFLQYYCSYYPKNEKNWLKIIRLNESHSKNPLPAYRAYLKIKPDDLEIQLSYGKALHERKYYYSAIGVFRKLAKQNPNHSYTQDWLRALSKFNRVEVYVISTIRQVIHAFFSLLGDLLLKLLVIPYMAVYYIVNSIREKSAKK